MGTSAAEINQASFNSQLAVTEDIKDMAGVTTETFAEPTLNAGPT